MLDIHTFIGSYPFRHLPHPHADALVRVLDREGVAEAWVAHLPSAFYRDPRPGNAELFESLAAYRSRLRAVATVRPDWPAWPEDVERAVSQGAAALRAYPMQWRLSAESAELIALADVCARYDLPLLLNVRFEDSRQRHVLDTAGDLTAAHIRQLARSRTGAKLIVTAAGRGLIEEVHFALTEDERSRLWWDISWIWGPPEDDIAHLLRSIGPQRFVYGSGWPLRLAQTPRANLALLPVDLVSVELSDPRALQPRSV